ncbi:MAG: tol-pal system protein YbgF [Gammaproteobacteria bacterium]|jgi:tol-pal system protein YbgF|nr:tol-pal system protein YbgF [Gammaproteobacteria bacterium]
MSQAQGFRLPLPAAIAAALMLGLAGPLPAMAADPALEARVSRLEQMLSERSLSDLLLQIQQLQQEVQELRGQVETHQYLLRQQGMISPDSDGSEDDSVSILERERLRPRFSGGTSGDAFVGEADRTPDWRLNRVPGSRVTTELGGPLDLDPFAVNGSREPAAATAANTETEAPRTGAAASGLLALPSPETAAGGERELYRKAFDLLKARDYPAARTAFEQMLTHYPQGQFADNARYWLGEIGYVTQDYAAAEAEFDRLVTDYPRSPKVPGAMLKLGYLYYEQDQLADAREMLQRVVQGFPNTSEAQLAKGRLERMERETD